jgi:hypothetical protein
MHPFAIAALLRDLYPDGEEVRRLAEDIEPELHHALSGALASPERLRTDLARLVHSRGLLGRLLLVLHVQRPHQSEHIAARTAAWTRPTAPRATPAPGEAPRSGDRSILIEAPARGEISLLRRLVELLHESDAWDIARLSDRLLYRGASSPALNLARGRQGLALHAFPHLLLGPEFVESTRALPLLSAAEALYCPFGRACPGPKFFIVITPREIDASAAVEIYPDTSPSARLRLRIEELDQPLQSATWR